MNSANLRSRWRIIAGGVRKNIEGRPRGYQSPDKPGLHRSKSAATRKPITMIRPRIISKNSHGPDVKDDRLPREDSMFLAVRQFGLQNWYSVASQPTTGPLDILAPERAIELSMQR